MTISNEDLICAIRAMDSYNRGYNAGLKIDNNTVIGDAQISTAKGDAEAQDAGFFAQAYTWNNETIISYRGTDVLPGLNLSLFNPASWTDIAAWSIWISANCNTSQAKLAAEFYRSIQQSVGGSIETTGHSLGGALAGFVAAIYGGSSTTFEHIDYQLAVDTLYNAVTLGIPNSLGVRVIDNAALAYYYGGANPWEPNYSGIKGFALQGEIAGQTRSDTPQTISIADDVVLGGISRHSQALLVTMMFGENRSDQDFVQAEKAFLPVLFDDAVGRAAGFITDPNGGGTGAAAESNQMLSAIAYTAIPSGYQPFGNTAIKSLFDDASDFGRVLAADNLAQYLKNNGAAQKAVADIFVQYAGLLALNRDTAVANNSGAVDLVGNRLIADFSPTRWQISASGEQVDIVGKKTLTEAVSAFGGHSHSSMQEAVNQVWSGYTDQIVKLVAATTDADVQLSSPSDAGVDPDAQGTNPTDGAMLAGGGGNDILTGAGGNDLLVGGAGRDVFNGAGGHDIMFGGAGDDIFILGDSGKNWIDGGDGYDSAYYDLSEHGHTITIGSKAFAANGEFVYTVTDTTTQDSDYFVSIENIDLHATAIDSGEILDFSNSDTGMYLKSGQPNERGGAVARYKDANFSKPSGVQFQNFDTLILSSHDDKVEIRSSDDPYLHQLYTGAGNDSVWSDVIALQIHTANDAGDSAHIEHTGRGTVINVGKGHAEIFVSDDTLVVGAKSTDVITSVGGTVLHGGVGHLGSESAWVTGNDGTRYGLNADGQLAIKDKSGAILYVADYAGGPNLPPTLQSAGILVGLVASYASRLCSCT